MRRNVGLLLLLGGVLGLVAWGFLPRPLELAVARVERAPLRVSLVEEGRTRVIDRYLISAPIAGYARRVELEVGDAVEPGQLLVELEPLISEVLDPRSRAQAKARVEAAQAALAAAREQLQAAEANAGYWETEHGRIERLYASGTASREQRDRAESEWRQARAAHGSARFRVDVARHELEAARTALEYAGARTGTNPETVAVRAPVAGRLLARLRRSEGVVQPAEPLLEIGDPARLEVVVEVLSADAVKLSPGMPVLFERWGGERPLEGSVRRVEPVGFTKVSALGVEEQRVLAICDFSEPRERWQQLGDGYRVEARFILWQADQVLQIPGSSAIRHREGWAVFVVEDGRARLRPVELGRRGELDVEVVSGLEPGDMVVAHPDSDVEDGTRVRPLAESKPGG